MVDPDCHSGPGTSRHNAPATTSRAVGWQTLLDAMGRNDPLGYLRSIVQLPSSPHAVFHLLGAQRRSLITWLDSAEAKPGAENLAAEIEAFIVTVSAESFRWIHNGPDGTVIWPWPDDRMSASDPPPPSVLGLVRDTGRRLLEELDLRRLLPLLVERSAVLTRASVAFLVIWDPATETLGIQESVGLPGGVKRLRLDRQERRALWEVGEAADAYFLEVAASRWLAVALADTGLARALVAPLSLQHEVWGAIVCAGADTERGGRGVAELLAVLADQTAIAIRNAALYREIVHKAAALRDANDRLRTLDTMKDRFLATVSHELRTPLNFITGFGGLLLEESDLPAKHHDYVSKMLEGAYKLLGLVDDLLDYSRIQAGHLALRRETFAPGTMLDETLEFFAPLATSLQVALALERPDWLAEIQGDRERLAQVISNLVANALKFTPPGGRIDLRARSERGTFRLEVQDSGIGIKSEDLNRLFTVFGQLDTSSTRKAGGTGLGLAICKSLVEAHGGTIGVVSPAPSSGDGCLFWFEIPLDLG